MSDLTEELRFCAGLHSRTGYPENSRLFYAAADRIAELEAALLWYGEQSRLCRLIHSEGDAGRQALAADGGKRARIAEIEGE